MLPHESKSSSNSQTVIKVEVEDQHNVELEFIGEQQEEKEDILQPPQFLNGADVIKNVDFNTKTAELSYDLKEKRTDENNNKITTKTKTKLKSTSTSFPVSVPVPVPAKENDNCDKKINHGQDPHPELKCSICNKEFPTRRKLTMHARSHKSKKFSCILCDFKGESVSALKIHFRIHTKEKTWKCPLSQCQMSFSHKQSQEYHLFSAHGIKGRHSKVFRCIFCSYQTINKAHHKTHVNNVHKSTMRFTCSHPSCSYQCAMKKNLSRHMQLPHSQNGPFNPASETETEPDKSTKNGKEIEPELVELKYEIKEENWVDESEQDPIINPTAIPATTTMRLSRLQRVPRNLSLSTFDPTSASLPNNKTTRMSSNKANNNNNNDDSTNSKASKWCSLRIIEVTCCCPKCGNIVRRTTMFNHLRLCGKKSTPSNLMQAQKDSNEQRVLDFMEAEKEFYEKQVKVSSAPTTSTTTTTSGSASTSGSSSNSTSTRATRIGNLQAVFINGKTHFIPVPAPIPERDEKDCDSNEDLKFHPKDQDQNQEFSCHLCDFKTSQSHLLTLHLPVHVKTRHRAGL